MESLSINISLVGLKYALSIRLCRPVPHAKPISDAFCSYRSLAKENIKHKPLTRDLAEVGPAGTDSVVTSVLCFINFTHGCCR